LTDIPQSECEYDNDLRILMQRIARGCSRLLCQSQGFIDLWKNLVPDLDIIKVKLYSPVIPDVPKDFTPVYERPLCAVYAGKFKSDWMTLEMALAWPNIQQKNPNSRLVMIGDKIHDEPDQPEYAARMRHALKHTS